MDEHEKQAAKLLKDALKDEKINYAKLGELIGESEAAIKNKLSRGKFQLAWALKVIEFANLQIVLQKKD